MKPQLIPCKSCGQSIARSAAKCPHCGKAFTSVARLILLGVLTILLVLFFGGGRFILDLMNKNEEMDAAQEQLESLRAR
jgi:sensor domain CHASE-containing protein